MPYYPPRSGGGVSLPLDHTDAGEITNTGTNTHALIDSHIASTANPHATTAAQVGADPVGTAAAAVATHVGLPDPHTQYALESSLGGAAFLNVGTLPGTVAAGDHLHTGVYDPAGTAAAAVAAHVGLPDPHSQYALDTDLAAYVLKSLYAAKGDILAASGAGIPVALAVGSDGDVLTADSAQPLGIKWAAAGAGSVNIKQTEIDFGASPLDETIFTIVDAGVSALSQLIAEIAFEQPTGRDLDEVEMETFEVKCTPAAGSFNALVRSLDGRVEGKYKLNYLIG